MQALLESPDLAQSLGEVAFQRVCTHFHEEAARAAFLPVIEEAAPQLSGLRAGREGGLARMYRLWLDQPIERTSALSADSLSTATSMQMASRLAKRGIRRSKALRKAHPGGAGHRRYKQFERDRFRARPECSPRAD